MWGRLKIKTFFTWAPMVASAWRKRWAKVKNPAATIRFGRHVYAGPGFSIHAPFGGTFEVGDGTEFRRNFRCELGGPQTVVRLGRQCVATYDVLFQVSSSLDIGDRVMFGQCTSVFDGRHNFEDPDVPMLEQGYTLRPLRFGDDVTILTKCTIVADLADRAVVGANSMVTKPVDAWNIVGGVPAKVIGTYGPVAGEATATATR